jgi:hypothetical protein
LDSIFNPAIPVVKVELMLTGGGRALLIPIFTVCGGFAFVTRVEGNKGMAQFVESWKSLCVQFSPLAAGRF